MTHALITLRRWLARALPTSDRDRGASLVEYALLVALIAVVCAVAVAVLGGTVSSSFSSAGSRMP